MIIENGKQVILHYTLTSGGKVVENQDIAYIHGAGMMIPDLERKFDGLQPGAEVAFRVTPEDGGEAMHFSFTVLDVGEPHHCCHGKGHGCHGEGHGEGHCCNGEGHKDGCCHKEE